MMLILYFPALVDLGTSHVTGVSRFKNITIKSIMSDANAELLHPFMIHSHSVLTELNTHAWSFGPVSFVVL